MPVLQVVILTKEGYSIFTSCLGLEKDLDMHGFDFNIALTTFYISVSVQCDLLTHLSIYDLLLQYIVSEIPSNLALKRFGSIWIAFLVISFGAVAIGSAFVKSFGSLLATRVLLGLAEGGTLVSLMAIGILIAQELAHALHTKSGLVYILARVSQINISRSSVCIKVFVN